MRAPSLFALALLALACSAPPPEPSARESAPAAAPETETAAPETEAAAQALAAPESTVTTGPEVGELAPDFILPTSEGGGFSLSEHRGRPVVLAFFRGTW